MEIALLGLFLVLALFAGVKPYTKEKFFFAGVVVLMAGMYFSNQGKSDDKLKAEVDSAKKTSAGASAAFGQQVEHGTGKPAPSDSVARNGEARIDRMAEGEYVIDSGSKSLYRRVVTIQPLGRIRMGGPATPGITVLTGYSQLGPSLRGLPARVPLGILDPERNQRPPLEDN